MLWSPGAGILWGSPPFAEQKPRKEIIHNMALIDEYKQAIQDVLDGRAKPAPRPSELPWTEDKAATMWAAAAAELIAEENAGGGGGGSGLPDTPGTDGTYALQNTVESGTGTLSWVKPLVVTSTDYGPMSSTYQEISDAFRSGRPVILFIEPSGELEYRIASTCANIVTVSEDEENDTYRVLFVADGGNISCYTAFSRNDYPEQEY